MGAQKGYIIESHRRMLQHLQANIIKLTQAIDELPPTNNRLPVAIYERQQKIKHMEEVQRMVNRLT
jgi:hypothetical protein